MRRLGVVAGIAVGLLLVVVAAAWFVLQSIDWNDYKGPIVEAARDATGRELDLGGELSLEIGLTPGVRIAAVRFENAEWGSREHMASLDQLVVKLELLPLLFGDVIVDRIDLVGLDVLLETNEEGVANWQFETAAEPPPAEPDPKPGEEDASDPMSLLLRSARIENAKVVVRDARTGAEQRVAVERLTAETEGPGTPLYLDLEAAYADAPIALSGSLLGISEVTSGAPLELDLELSAGGAEGTIAGRIEEPLEAKGLDLAVSLAGDSLAGMNGLAGTELPALGPYAVSLELSGGGERFAVRDLDLTVGESKLAGTVDADLSGERPRVVAKLTSPLLDAASFEDPNAPEPAASGETAPEAGGDGRVFSDEPLGLEGLRGVDADVTLEATTIRSGELALANTKIGVDLVAGRLRVDPLSTELARGTVEGALSLDGSRDVASMAVEATVRGLVIGDVLAAQGSDVLVDGPLDVDLAVKGRGASLHDVMAGLEGSFGMRMGRAVVNDEWAALALSDVSSLADAAVAAGRGAEISCLLAAFDVSQGVARPEGLVVDLGTVALFGDGKVDLGREKIDLRFDRQSYAKKSAGRALPPFEVKGTLAEPKPGVDATAAVGHVVDLTASILGKKKDEDTQSAAPRPGTCEELLAAYEAADVEPRSKADVASDAAELIVGEKKTKKAKKKVQKEAGKLLKGLLGD